MKKIGIIGFLSVIFLLVVAIGVQADTGPFFLYSDGSCNCKEIYMTSDGTLYGEEIGCPRTYPDNMMAGGKTTNGGSFGYVYGGSPRVIVYNANGTWQIFSNNGTSLSLFNQGTWSFGPAPTLESLKSLAILPSVDE
jgi:hypothetical protein